MHESTNESIVDRPNSSQYDRRSMVIRHIQQRLHGYGCLEQLNKFSNHWAGRILTGKYQMAR